MEWNESGITSLSTDFSGSGEGSLEILDFLFNGFNGLIGISIDEISIAGNLDVNLIIEDNNVVFTTTAGMTELVVSEANIEFSHYALNEYQNI